MRKNLSIIMGIIMFIITTVLIVLYTKPLVWLQTIDNLMVYINGTTQPPAQQVTLSRSLRR